MQKTLDHYGAGIQVTQVQLQKVDPPAQVIDSFRDVQAARSDAERAQNEAQTYANRVVPEARGRAAQITQAAEAYRRADRRRGHRPDVALPQDLRRVQEGARRHPRAHVSRDHGAAVQRHRQDHHRFRSRRAERRRALSAAQRADAAAGRATGDAAANPPPQAARRPEATDEAQSRRRRPCGARAGGADHRLRLAVHRLSDRSGAGGAAGRADPRGDRARPELQDSAARQRHLGRQAHPRSGKSGPGGHRLRPEAAGGRCLRALPHQ